MFPIFSRAKLFTGKTAAAALIAATTLGVAAAPSSAYAGDGKGHRFGHGAAAFGGGLLLGAIIASNSRDRGYDRGYDRDYDRGYGRECWNERHKRVNVYGEVSFRKVRVCD